MRGITSGVRPPIVSPVVTQMYRDALSIFRDAYTVEFLGLPPAHAEADLHLLSLKVEGLSDRLGRDFCFVGSEYPLAVGGRDFAIDLALLPSRIEQPGRLRTEGGRIRAGVPWQTGVLSRSSGSGCAESA